MRSASLIFVLHVCALSSAYEKRAKLSESGVENKLEGPHRFWNEKAQNYLKATLERKENTNKAKNIIFFIGDGMSIPTVAATRMYMGNEATELSFDKFPHYGLSRTYCVDKQVADSACTATAYLGGVKNNYRSIGVNANVKSTECYVEESDRVNSIGKWAQDACKGVGIVTTTRVTHASPAGVFAHTPHRDWEHNAAVEAACATAEKTNVKDIAYQLVHGDVGMKLKVILAGGRSYFINQTETDEEGQKGLRTDGRNLLEEWMEDRNKGSVGKYVWHKQQLDETDFESTDYLMGLFEGDHCLYNTDIVNNNLEAQEPSLTDMTVAAIKMLQKEKNGYFLFVEGGKIDHAHHDTKAQKALEETKELARAIEVARLMTSLEDTLIVVSSDHSHTNTYSGYAARNNDILGMAGISDLDGLPYDTISYANGPGYRSTYLTDSQSRVDLRSVDMKDPDRLSSATVPLSSETHAGDDVGVFASGPWSHLFSGSFEQNVIPHLMAKAAEIGPYSQETTTCSAVGIIAPVLLFLTGLVVTLLL